MTSAPGRARRHITANSDNIPESGLAAVARTAIAGRGGGIVVRRWGGAGLSRLRNNLTRRCIATGRGSRSSLLLEFVVRLERHDGYLFFLFSFGDDGERNAVNWRI